jgi:hypothetical protein
MIQNVQVLPGSASVIDPRMQRIGEVQGNEPITVSLYVKAHEAPSSILRTAPAPFERRGAMRQSRKIAYRDDFALVSAFARDTGLDVIAVDAGRLLMTLRGPAAAMEVAFGTKLWIYRLGTDRYRSREGALTLATPLIGIVSAVLGLETTPIARSRPDGES